MLSFSGNNLVDVIEAFNTMYTLRYLYCFNIGNPYFEKMKSQIYPAELHLNKRTSFVFNNKTILTANVLKQCYRDH